MEFRTERQVLLAIDKTEQQTAAEQDLDTAKQTVAKLVNERAETAAQIASAELRIQFLKSTAEGKMSGNGVQANQTAEQLAGMVTALGSAISTAVVELTKAKNTLAQSARALDEAHEAVALAEIALDAVTPLERETGTAVIDLVTADPFSGDLTLMYSNNDASWSPSYEVSVDQDGAKAKVNLVRLAAVQQGSYEDWSGVSVTLSTSDLQRTAEVYLPRSDIKFIYEPEKLQRLRKQSFDQSTMGSIAEPAMEIAAVNPSAPRVELRGQTLEFELGIVSSLQGDGAPKLFRLDAIQSDVDLRAEATIGQNEIAVLYADLENTTGGSMLPGHASLIRDGVLVGEASIPEVANGDTFDLALGPLNGILLEKRTLEVQDGDTGIISSYNQKIEKYEVSIRSLLDYPIDVTTYTALPVSESEDLEVVLDTKPNPNEKDIEGHRGVVGWTLQMDANSTQTITYGWKLKWPEDQTLGRR
jgi:uncharacterized protein (TIGR02231 family)